MVYTPELVRPERISTSSAIGPFSWADRLMRMTNHVNDGPEKVEKGVACCRSCRAVRIGSAGMAHQDISGLGQR
jgi:hypothetical protein